MEKRRERLLVEQLITQHNASAVIMETGGHPVTQHKALIRNNQVYTLSDESVDPGSDDGGPDSNPAQLRNAQIQS